MCYPKNSVGDGNIVKFVTVLNENDIAVNLFFHVTGGEADGGWRGI